MQQHHFHLTITVIMLQLGLPADVLSGQVAA